MTIPTRPAPPPPGRNQASSNCNASSTSSLNKFVKKPAPPRPPPPKALPSFAVPLKKSGSQKSISILSNLFGAKHSNKSNDKPLQQPANFEHVRLPPKIPAPPSSLALKQNNHKMISDVQLINFEESPSSSPPTIKKSNTGSDSVSMDSFCSSTSSPNNLGSGTTSQAESGFEDDFSVSDFKVTSGATSRSTTFSNDPFECLDDFGASSRITFQPPSNIRNVKPVILPKPSAGGSSFFTGSNVPSQTVSFDDSLSNGKTIFKPSMVSMPTIIKPPMANKGKASPTLNFVETKKTTTVLNHQISEESIDDDLPSLPMPTVPPPPPPCLQTEDCDEEVPASYAIALYDFESDVDEDLNIRANDKIYLIKQMNDEWMFGRNKRGCEGIFPISYVDIRVPLKQVEPDSGTASRSASVSPAVEAFPVRALYAFNAETDEDLTIKENEIINVMFEINPEWLYGSNEGGDYGQFPSNFLEYVPQSLPQMPK